MPRTICENKVAPIFAVLRRVQIFFLLLSTTFFVLLEYLLIEDSFLTHVHMPIAERCDEYSVKFSVNVSDSPVVPGGSRIAGGRLYPPWAMWNDSDRNLTMACPCRVYSCLPKCCPSLHSYPSLSNLTCEPNNNTADELVDNITFYYKLNLNEKISDLRIKNTSHNECFVMENSKVCDDNHIYEQVEDEKVFLLEDGTIIMDNLTLFDIDDYCIEYVGGTVRVMFNNYCVDPNKTVATFAGDILTICIAITGSVLSIVSLIATIAVYCVLPHLRNTQGKMLICFLICLVIYYIAYIFKNIQDVYVKEYVVIVYLNMFSFYNRLMWVTMMCFEMWYKFSHPLTHRFPNRQDSLKFLVYSVVGWGVPNLCFLLTVIVAVSPDQLGLCPRPRFYYDTCAFDIKTVEFILLFLPMVFLVLMNLVLFLSVLINIWCLHVRRIGALSPGNVRRGARIQKDGLYMYIKLSLIMGVQFFLSIFWLSLEDIVGEYLATLMFVLTNSSYGVVMFVILILNQRMIAIIRHRLGLE